MGTNGTDGADGKDGKDGVGIKNVTVSAEGILTVTLDNDTVITLGNIKGKDGVGIAKTEINAEGKLVITYTDDKVVTLGKVVGNDGVGIKSVELTDDYMLKLTFTDNGTQTLGPIRGEKGADGKDGVGIKEIGVSDDGYLYVTYTNSEQAQKIAYIKGDKGDKGDTGADGKTPYILNGTWWIGDTNTGVKAEGVDGQDGTNGTNGTNGQDGVGVQNAYINSESHLIIVLTNGTEIDAGYVGGSGSVVPLEKFTVTFKDHDGKILKMETVEDGKSATAPADPTRDGYVFAGWDGNYTNVTSDVTVTATYKAESSASYTVTFYDYDGSTVLKTQTVAAGSNATPPANPTKNGANFIGWNGNYTNIQKNESVKAVYSDDKNIFFISSANGTVGDTVTVLVETKGNVCFAGFDFNLLYDSNLELISYDSDVGTDVTVNANAISNGIIINYSKDSNVVKQKGIIELTFKILGTGNGALPIDISMTKAIEITQNTDGKDDKTDTVYSIVSGIGDC